MLNVNEQLKGDGGVRQLLSIAFPMFVSQAADTLMMFVDRLFLARLGKEHIAAAMGGGMTCFMMFTLFLGVIGYTNALVAQFLGSGRGARCGVASAQGFLIALASYPVILLLRPLGLRMMAGAGHDPLQFQLETAYYSILIRFAFLPLFRSVMGSFFSGIGRTRVVMVSSMVAMLVNVVANYALIFGRLGFPALGMRGAAYGTIIGSAVGVLILGRAYFHRSLRKDFGTWSGLRFDRGVMRTLLRFGTPSGVEFFLNMAAFNFFVQLVHSYGRDVAAAVTITFNWDMVAFVPVIGISAGTTSLVGRYMGARSPETAERAAYSGLLSALCYTLIVFALFVSIPRVLVGVFTPDLPGLDYSAVFPRAVFMLRLASLYLVFDAMMLVFGGALRGAGDTRWVMCMSVFLHWLLAVTCWVQVRVLRASPETVWVVFVALVTLMGCVFFARFRTGHWKRMTVLEGGEETRQPPVLPAVSAPVQDFPEVRD